MPNLSLRLSPGAAWSFRAGGVSIYIAFTGGSVLESASVGASLGTLSVVGGTGTYTFTETADPDGKFTVASGGEVTLAAAVDYEAKTSHSFTVSADNGAGSVVTRTFTINVTNVFEQPNLGALTLSASQLTQNQAATVNIVGATAGSTITGTVPDDMTLNSAARTITGTPTTVGSYSFALTETLADSANSPRSSTVALEVVAGGAVAGATRTSFASTGLTPALHYHPNTETVTKDGSNRLTGVSANTWGPALTASATGPLESTDALGRKRWQFDGTHYLDVPTTFAANPRQVSVFIVGRVYKPSTTNNLFSISFQADGTTALSGGSLLRSLGTGGMAPWLYNSGIASFNAAVNKEYLSPGSQIQVMGLASRTTANGGSKFFNNSRASDNLAQSGVTSTGTKGARIGGNQQSNGTTNFLGLYEIAVFTGELTDAQAQAIADAMVANWSIPAVTQNLVLEGDSITDGITEVVASKCLGAQLTEPGAGLIPGNVRVLNRGVSGGDVASLITRRDITNGWPSMKIGASASDNIVAVQIGRNDYSALKSANPTWTEQELANEIYNGGKAGTTNNIVNYYNAATSGIVARGWKPVQATNIQNGTSDDNGLELLANNIRSGFAAAVSGGSIIDLRAISTGGVLAFEFPLQTQFYQAGDSTHPNVVGTGLMASGGDTPANGYGAIL